ncbi:MAG: peptidoglycan DD-metalloendopeptidase family protein, partial [Alphaproteobacteria bacterium]
FQKYRQILIVEHAGGYHSLIAGLGRIDTVVGATLAAGEPVGIAEKSDDGARIYYELRQNGAPVNPRKLLVAQKKQTRT